MFFVMFCVHFLHGAEKKLVAKTTPYSILRGAHLVYLKAQKNFMQEQNNGDDLERLFAQLQLEEAQRKFEKTKRNYEEGEEDGLFPL